MCTDTRPERGGEGGSPPDLVGRGARPDHHLPLQDPPEQRAEAEEEEEALAEQEDGADNEKELAAPGLPSFMLLFLILLQGAHGGTFTALAHGPALQPVGVETNPNSLAGLY